MYSIDRGPRHLAKIVLRALSVTDGAAPDRSLLTFFFHVLYKASFNLEHGQSTVCSVLWMDAACLPSPTTSARTKHGGSYLALTQPIPFNVNALVEMAAGMDPDASALVVSPSAAGTPVIHGLVNHGAEPLRFGPRLAKDQAGPSGSFHAKIVGPAHIRVDIGLEQPVELKHNQLYTQTHDVLRQGPVRDRFSTGLAGLFTQMRAQIPPDVVSSQFLETQALLLKDGIVLFDDVDWAETLERVWVDVFVRLLRSIWKTGQGGAVVVAPPPEHRLKLKQGTDYSHLRLLLEQRCALALTQHLLSAKALSESALPLKEMNPADLILPESDILSGALSHEPEITQALAFIAALARVDGLLLLTPHLDLKGFGGQAGPGEAPDCVYLAGDAQASEEKLSPVSYASFGQRSQALIRRCYLDPSAVGFLLTQDGDIRAMLWHEGKVIVWNQVRLHREWDRL